MKNLVKLKNFSAFSKTFANQRCKGNKHDSEKNDFLTRMKKCKSGNRGGLHQPRYSGFMKFMRTVAAKKKRFWL